MICIFVIIKGVKTDIEIWQCNAESKDVILPSFHPTILYGNNTPQFCKITKNFSTIMWLLATDAIQCSWLIVHPPEISCSTAN